MFITKLRSQSKQKQQVVLLYFTTMVGVALGVLASVINTRFLSPADYGDVRYVQNIINFIASLLLFGYFLSGSRMLALSKDEYRSRTIRGLMLIILIIACYAIHVNTNEHLSWLFIASLPVCFFPLLLNYINTVFQGDNYIGRISIARLLPSLIYVCLAYLIYSKYGASSEKMILLQWGVYTVILFAIIFSAQFNIDNAKIIFHEVNKENKQYGFQLYIGSLVMVATNYIAGITLGMFNQDNSEVGFYTLALTVTSPLATLPAIIGTTYFKQFASQPKIPNKVMKASILLTAGSCLLFILLIKPIVVFLYSEDYATVGTYAIWLSVGFCIHGFGDMINRYLGSHGQGISIRNSSVSNGVFKLFGYTALVYLWNTNGALLTNILCSFIYCFVLLIYYYKFIKQRHEQV